MIDRFNGLRHHAIVSRHHQNHNIGNPCTARPHCGEGRMARRVDKTNHTAIERYLIRTNMLRNAPGLTAGNPSFSNGIEQGCFTMVDVAHDSDHGWAMRFFDIIIFNALDAFFNVRLRHTFNRMAQFFGNQLRCVRIDCVINFGHHALLHQAFDHFDRPLRHSIGQFLDGDGVGNNDGSCHFFHWLIRRRLTLFTLTAATDRCQ